MTKNVSKVLRYFSVTLCNRAVITAILDIAAADDCHYQVSDDLRVITRKDKGDKERKRANYGSIVIFVGRQDGIKNFSVVCTFKGRQTQRNNYFNSTRESVVENDGNLLIFV